MSRRWVALAGLLTLAGCGGGPPPAPVVYKPLNYSYLPPISLRVASVNVTNQYVPGPDEANLIGQDPEAPANALSDELNRRLIPSGAPGTANVTIETASLTEAGGNLSGTLTVRIDVASADGRRTGYTEASVSRSQAAPAADASADEVRGALYDMTDQMMQAMNVQLPYQLQHNLGSWIVYGNSAAVAPVSSGAIQATPLPSPGNSPAAASTPAAGAPSGPTPGPATGPVPLGANGLPEGSLPLGSLPLGSMPVPPTGTPTNGMPQ